MLVPTEEIAKPVVGAALLAASILALLTAYSVSEVAVVGPLR